MVNSKKIHKGIKVVLWSIIICCIGTAVYCLMNMTTAIAYADSAYESYLEDQYPNLLTYEVFADNLKNIEQLYTDVRNAPKHIAIDSNTYKTWVERHPNDGVKRTATVHAVMHVAPPVDVTLTDNSQFEYLVLLSVRGQSDATGTVHYLAVTFEEGMLTELIEIV